jgi:hypothetical protein
MTGAVKNPNVKITGEIPTVKHGQSAFRGDNGR